MPSSPLNPSIRFAPLIINKKHKQIKNNAKMSISNKLFKNNKPDLSIQVLLYITKIIKRVPIIISLNFGAIFTFKSSIKPKRKNNVQKDIYSK